MKHDIAWLVVSALIGVLIGGLVFHSLLMEIRYTERGNVEIGSVAALGALMGFTVFMGLAGAFQHKEVD